jgi:hypothetical protein
MQHSTGKTMNRPDAIDHFLLSLDDEREELDVREFGTDYDAALAAYSAAELADAEGGLDIVLISADSLATIEQTHSSYFNDVRGGLEELLADAASR